MTQLQSLRAFLEIKIPDHTTSTEIEVCLDVVDTSVARVPKKPYFSSTLCRYERQYSDESRTEKTHSSNLKASPCPVRPSTAAPPSCRVAHLLWCRAQASAGIEALFGSTSSGTPCHSCPQEDSGRRALQSGAAMIAEINEKTHVRNLAPPASVAKGSEESQGVYVRGNTSTTCYSEEVPEAATGRQKRQGSLPRFSTGRRDFTEDFYYTGEDDVHKQVQDEKEASKPSAGDRTVTFDLRQDGQIISLENKLVFLTINAQEVRYFPEFDFSLVRPVDVADLDLCLRAWSGTPGEREYCMEGAFQSGCRRARLLLDTSRLRSISTLRVSVHRV